MQIVLPGGSIDSFEEGQPIVLVDMIMSASTAYKYDDMLYWKHARAAAHITSSTSFFTERERACSEDPLCPSSGEVCVGLVAPP